MGQIGGHRALAHAALAAGHGDDVLHALDPGRARRGGRGRLLQIDKHVRRAHAGDRGQRFHASTVDLPGDLGIFDRQRKFDENFVAAHLGGFDQTERNDVAAEARILHRPQGFAHSFFVQVRHDDSIVLTRRTAQKDFRK